MANIPAIADHRRTTPGYVYFIRAGKTQFVKIGWTSDLRMRLSVLQTGNQAKLKVLRVLPGSRNTEVSIQVLFGRWRRRGEWFWLDAEIAKFIDDSAKDCVLSEALRRREPACLTEDEIVDILARAEAREMEAAR